MTGMGVSNLIEMAEAWARDDHRCSKIPSECPIMARIVLGRRSLSATISACNHLFERIPEALGFALSKNQRFFIIRELWGFLAKHRI